MTDTQLIEDIRAVLDQFGGLASPASKLDGDTDLFAAGMTSFASVSVMLGLEDRLSITFPDSMLKRGTFESINSMAVCVTELRSAHA
jgi:acyl carrier protein